MGSNKYLAFLLFLLTVSSGFSSSKSSSLDTTNELLSYIPANKLQSDSTDLHKEEKTLSGEASPGNDALAEGLYSLAEDMTAQMTSHVPFWYTNSPPTDSTGYSSSTIYAISYENLLIIIALKLMLVFGLFGGFGFVGFAGRSMEAPYSSHDSILDSEDLLFVLTFLQSSNSAAGGNHHQPQQQCLQRMACLQTQRAEDILMAARTLQKAVRMVELMVTVPVSSHEALLNSVEEAVEYSYSGGVCRDRYTCTTMPSL